MILEKLLILFVLFVSIVGVSVDHSTKQYVYILNKIQQFVSYMENDNTFLLIIDNIQHPFAKAQMIKLAQLVKTYTTDIQILRIKDTKWQSNKINLKHPITIGQGHNQPKFYLFDRGHLIENHERNQNYLQINQWIRNYFNPQIHQITQQQIKTINPPFYLLKTLNQQKIQLVMRIRYTHQHFPIYSLKLNELSNYKQQFVFIKNDQQKRIYHGPFQMNSVLLWLESSQSRAIKFVENMHDLHIVVSHKQKFSMLFYVSEGYGDNIEEFFNNINKICQKYSYAINCGQLSPQTRLRNIISRRLDLQKNAQFIGIFEDFTKIGYYFQENVQQFIANPQKYSQILQEFLLKVIKRQISPKFDHSVPDKIQYQEDIALTPQQFDQEIQYHEKFFIKFYHKQQFNSKSAYRSYLKFIDNLYMKHRIQSGAIDCHEYHQFCKSHQIFEYPKFALYVKKIPVFFGANKQLSPTSENLINFIDQRLHRQINLVRNWEQTNADQHALIFQGARLQDQLEVFAKKYHQLPIYLIKTHPDYYRYQLHLRLCGVNIPHINKVVNIDYYDISNWIKNQQKQKLKDLTLYQLERSNEQLSIYLLLVIQHTDDSELYEGIIGCLCEKLQIKCRMLLKSYMNFNKIAQRMNLPKPIQDTQTLFYIDKKNSQAIKFPEQKLANILQLKLQDIKIFIQQSYGKKLDEIQELSIHHHSTKAQNEDL